MFWTKRKLFHLTVHASSVLRSSEGKLYSFLISARETAPGMQWTQDPRLKKTKLHGLSPRANYTDRATAACRRIEGATWSA
jgi:hypothetical protein